MPVQTLTDNLTNLKLNDKNNNLNKPSSSEPATSTTTTTTTTIITPTPTPTPAPTVASGVVIDKPKTGGPLNSWTPENKEGKKRYDRDFLMSFKEKKLSRAFPDALKGHSEILFSAESGANMAAGSGGNTMLPRQGSMQGGGDYSFKKNQYSGSMGGDNMGGYNKNSSMKKPHKGSMNMGKMNKGSSDRQPPAVINLPEKIVLNTVDNPYIIKKVAAVELNELDELLREVRNILNKLTPQNLQKLTGDLINLAINSEDRLKGSIDIIFEKSIDEQVFSQTYANLCKVCIYVHYIHS